MLDWIEYRKELLGCTGEIDQITPNTVEGCKTLSAAMTGSLDVKTRGLIALAVTVTTRYDGCITVHMAKATKHGAAHKKIADALSVAISLNTRAALVYSACVLDVVQAYGEA